MHTYLCLHSLPHSSGGGYKDSGKFADLSWKTSLWAEIALSHGAKDLINGGVGGQGAVKDGELPLQTLRDVISTTTGVYHGCHQLLKIITLSLCFLAKLIYNSFIIPETS